MTRCTGWRPDSIRKAVLAAAALLVGVLWPWTARAQSTAPAAAASPPDDRPTIKVGATIFTDYTLTEKPEATDSDGNAVHPNSFNVSRSYINVAGNISHIVSFRITPDVFRETNAASAGSGSLVFRIKYAFGQIALDDWMPKGSWVRLGIQQTPYLDFMEGVYRYRFQGTMFAEREGPLGSGSFISSSDAGLSFHTTFPHDYGDLHAGIYNGEFYSKAETNDQKAVEIRATVRPLPTRAVLSGFRVTGFYVADHYVRNADRRRLILTPTFEQTHVTVGFEYLVTRDRQSALPAGQPDVPGRGWSLWATPKFARGFEALLRYDRMRPDADNAAGGGDGVNRRTIAGVSYWFPHEGNVSSALLVDIERVSFAFAVPKPAQQRLAVHALFGF